MLFIVDQHIYNTIHEHCFEQVPASNFNAALEGPQVSPDGHTTADQTVLFEQLQHSIFTLLTHCKLNTVIYLIFNIM